MKSEMGWNEIKELVDMKRHNPQEYDKFVENFKAVAKDMTKLSMEIADEITEERKNE